MRDSRSPGSYATGDLFLLGGSLARHCRARPTRKVANQPDCSGLTVSRRVGADKRPPGKQASLAPTQHAQHPPDASSRPTGGQREASGAKLSFITAAQQVCQLALTPSWQRITSLEGSTICNQQPSGRQVI